MSTLGGMVLILGSLQGVLFAFMTFSPNRMRGVLKRFPRNRYAGWALAALDLWWSARLLLDMDMGFLNVYKPWLYFLAPAVFVLLTLYLDDLLAARALGGLFLLIPAPLIEAARFHESPFRYVILILAYLMTMKGMALVISPYLFRKTVERFIADDSACRTVGFSGLVFSFGLVLSGVFAFL